MIRNLLIYGSCVSRDIFNLEESRSFKLTDYFARSSLGSLASPAYSNTKALNRIQSAFRRRMVSYDFSKELLVSDYKVARAHTVLVDLIDERFDLINLPTGQVITHSSELAESGLLNESSIEGYRTILHGSEERRELWLRGMHIFLDLLKKHNKLDRLIINKVYWASKFAKDSNAELPVAPATIDKANAELDWMYSKLSEELDSNQFLEIPPELLTADESHRWGISPFHYCDDFYKEALTQIIAKQKPQDDSEATSSYDAGTHCPPISSGVTLSVAAYRSNNEVFAHCSLVLNGRICDSGNFAFYLFIGGNRHSVRWYDPSESARFTISDTEEELTVAAFYKDELEQTITLKCNVANLALN